MWTAETRAPVGDLGAGQALSDEQYAFLVPLSRRPSPAGGHARPTCTGSWTACSTWCAQVASGRHLPPPPAFPPWRTVYGYMRVVADGGRVGGVRHHLVVTLRERDGKEPSPSATVVDTQSVKTTEKGVARRSLPSGQPKAEPGMPPRRSRAGSATSRSAPRACS